MAFEKYIGPKIFVFGSNLAGHHGAGAARDAVINFGAMYGAGVGHHGNSYAIPTKDQNVVTLPIGMIRIFVDMFLDYARRYPHFQFYVTPIGTGLAGYTHEDIAPLFATAPENCELPTEWQPLFKGQ